MYHKIAHFNRINEDDITAINSFFLRQEVTQIQKCLSLQQLKIK